MPIVLLIVGVLWLVLEYHEVLISWGWSCFGCAGYAIGGFVVLLIVCGVINGWLSGKKGGAATGQSDDSSV